MRISEHTVGNKILFLTAKLMYVSVRLTFHWHPKEMGSGQLLMNSVKEKVIQKAGNLYKTMK